MSNFFVSSFEKHQRIDGKESRIKGYNQNGHVKMEGVIDGKKFVYDNNEPEHKVFRKTPYPSSSSTRRHRNKKRKGRKRKTVQKKK